MIIVYICFFFEESGGARGSYCNLLNKTEQSDRITGKKTERKLQTPTLYLSLWNSGYRGGEEKNPKDYKL